MLWTENSSVFGKGISPWNDIERMQKEISRLLSSVVPSSSQDFPAVNVWTNEEKALVTTELPGISDADVEISVAGKLLTVRGSREPVKIGEDESYHRRERWYGNFTKTVEIPFPIDAEKVEAKLNKGILSISLPRLEADKPKKITINIA